LQAGTTKDLTPAKKVNARVQDISHRFPQEILIALNDRDERYHDVYRVNITTGDKQLLQKNEDGYLAFVTDDDYRVRFALKFNAKGGQDVYQPTGKGEWKEFLSIPAEDALTTTIAGFNESGDVAYMLDSRERDTAALTSLDLKTGKQKVLAQNEQADISGI